MAKVKSNNGMEAKGSVSIKCFRHKEDGTKEYFDYFDKDNLIVELGRSVVVDLLLGESDKRLTFIEWGSGGAPTYPEGNPLQEYEVKDEEISLNAPVLKKVLGDYERVSPTSFRYVETLISDEVNSNINEVCLIFRDNKTSEESMFSKLTFPTIALLADKGFGIELTWTINFRKIIYKPEE